MSAKTTLKIFFEVYEKEIKFFQNPAPSITRNVVYDDFNEFDGFVNALIAIYENNLKIVTSDLNGAIDFITHHNKYGTDDNFMGLNLRLAYFHCIAAIVEYLVFILED